MYKILFIILLFVSTSFAYKLNDADLKALKELGLESSFVEQSLFKEIFDEYSSDEKISYYDNLLRKSSLNMQIVKDEIEKENLPSAVFFIPLIESSFVNQSKSKNSPAGLWQIIPQTAKSLRLRVDESIDERLDLIKSTDAAGSYLKKYHVRLKKWYLALIAYTCGEGRVIEGITRATIDEYLEQNPQMVDDISIRSYKNSLDNYKKTKQGLSDLYDIFDSLQRKGYKFSFSYLIANNDKNDYLPSNSLEYISKIVAFSILSERDEFKSIDKKAKYELSIVKAPNALQLKSIANAISMNYNEFKNLNKHIKKEILPTDSKKYNIYIPKGKLDSYNQKIAIIRPSKEVVVNNSKQINTNKNSNKPIIYTIKKGDTLESIAKKHNVSIKKLKLIERKDNKSKLLKIGDKIEITKS